jgi:predicted amino acid racemase
LERKRVRKYNLVSRDVNKEREVLKMVHYWDMFDGDEDYEETEENHSQLDEK